MKRSYFIALAKLDFLFFPLLVFKVEKFSHNKFWVSTKSVDIAFVLFPYSRAVQLQ